MRLLQFRYLKALGDSLLCKVWPHHGQGLNGLPEVIRKSIIIMAFFPIATGLEAAIILWSYHPSHLAIKLPYPWPEKVWHEKETPMSSFIELTMSAANLFFSAFHKNMTVCFFIIFNGHATSVFACLDLHCTFTRCLVYKEDLGPV